ncbi:early growth response protein 3, partial [Clonorchis sinensis]
PPLYCRTNTELPASALLVRRLSRLRNRGGKSNMHCCRTAMGSPQSQLSRLTTSPPSASESNNASEQQQQLKETEPRGKYFTGCCEDKHSAYSPSDLASCEIAFTIRVHPDDPSAKFLRDLALDGLARCCDHHHSVTTRSDISHPISVDVRLRRPMHMHRDHSKCSEKPSKEHDSKASSVSDIYSPKQTADCEHCSQRDSESYNSVVSFCAPATEESMDLSDSSLTDFAHPPYPMALASPGNFKKLLRDRYLSSQHEFDRVFSAPITPNHECVSNGGGGDDASCRDTNTEFNTSSKLLRTQSECKLDSSRIKLTPLDSNSIFDSIDGAISSRRTSADLVTNPSSIASPGVLLSGSWDIPRSKSKRVMSSVKSASPSSHMLSRESVETGLYLPDGTKTVETIESTNETCIRYHSGLASNMYADPSKSAVDRAATEEVIRVDPKHTTVSSLLTTPPNTSVNDSLTARSITPKNLRPEERSIFSFNSPSWTNITAGPFTTDSSDKDTTTKSLSAPISPERVTPLPRGFKGTATSLQSPNRPKVGYMASSSSRAYCTATTIPQHNREVFVPGLKHLSTPQNSPLVASMPTFHRPSSSSDPGPDFTSAVASGGTVFSPRHASAPSIQTAVAATACPSPIVATPNFGHLSEAFRNSLLAGAQFQTGNIPSSQAFVFPPPSPLRLSTNTSKDSQVGVTATLSSRGWVERPSSDTDMHVTKSNAGSRETEEYFSRLVENFAHWASGTPGDGPLSFLKPLSTVQNPTTPISKDGESERTMVDQNVQGTKSVNPIGCDFLPSTVNSRSANSHLLFKRGRLQRIPRPSRPNSHGYSGSANTNNSNTTGGKDDPNMLTVRTLTAPHRSTAARGRGSSSGGLHVCPICSRQFNRSDMLVRHAHVHTGHRPFECTACGQAFSRSDHLSTHQRTHTGHRPYRCPLCSYSACRRDMITRHLRVHQRRGQLGNLDQFKHFKTGFSQQLNSPVAPSDRGTHDSTSYPRLTRGARKPRRNAVMRSAPINISSTVTTDAASLPSPPPLTFHTAPLTSSSSPVFTS